MKAVYAIPAKKSIVNFDRMKALHQGAAYGTMAKKAGKGERI
jgi:hypothetical protein